MVLRCFAASVWRSTKPAKGKTISQSARTAKAHSAGRSARVETIVTLADFVSAFKNDSPALRMVASGSAAIKIG